MAGISKDSSLPKKTRLELITVVSAANECFY
jgi:hypothetical protein